MRARIDMAVFDALQISPERIAAMRDEELKLLMGDLLKAQAYLCDSPVNEVRVNTEDKAKDDGCDGWTAKPLVSDAWLGDAATCWQFKAGIAGEPSRLKNEVKKRIPSETLNAGGRLVVVASGSTNGLKGESDRLESLANSATNLGIASASIHVFGSERLATWCNEHKAIAGKWSGRPIGVWWFEKWAMSEEHQVVWQASDEVTSLLADLRTKLAFDRGQVRHLHIYGHPGVGKTRFALELCRGALWRGSVVYIQQTSDARLLELIDSVANDSRAKLVVVADEVQYEEIRPLHRSIELSNGRIRLITIGHCESPDPVRIHAIKVEPLDQASTRLVVRGWYSAMPIEHVDFVARFADGYIRLARLAADAIANKSTTVDVRGLLSQGEIRRFLDSMLDGSDRRALHVVAVLRSVGWDEELQMEGRCISEHFGLNWNEVRATVEAFHRQFGIAPRGGRYRYISPAPLGSYLAVEAWTTYPDLLRELPNILPNEMAVDAYYDRLKSIASNPHAKDFARDELQFFFRLEQFAEKKSARRWAALSSAAPKVAAGLIFNALNTASVDDRQQISDNARREIVWALTRIAWREDAFPNAVKALALLAEAENETWSNNASGEFVSKFQLFLSGTATPFQDRLTILDDLLRMDRDALVVLVVRALARACSQHNSRTSSDDHDEPQTEWHPANQTERDECIVLAVDRLTSIVARARIRDTSELVKVACRLNMLLRLPRLRSSISRLYDEIRKRLPGARESLRRAIADVIYNERRYWNEHDLTSLEELYKLHESLVDHSLKGQLRQLLGQSFPDLDPDQCTPDLGELAKGLLAAPEILNDEWQWLTSGEAYGAWRLGEALSKADPNSKLLEAIKPLVGEGSDLRIICGYVSECRQRLGDEWYDQWIDGQLVLSPKPTNLLFQLAWRCGTTRSLAEHIIRTLQEENVDARVVGAFGFVNWGNDLDADLLARVLRAMIDSGHSATALQVLHSRLKFEPTAAESWRDLTLELVVTPELIRADSYHWQQTAKLIAESFPFEIATAIFREQSHGAEGNRCWFAEHGPAAEVLESCASSDSGAVWRAMYPFLEDRREALLFTIGFPDGLFRLFPQQEVTSWVAENAIERASLLAAILPKDFDDDESIASKILGELGSDQDVADAFFSQLITGIWWGEASAHWKSLAQQMSDVASRTRRPKLRLWARQASERLMQMSERDARREAEEELRGRGQ